MEKNTWDTRAFAERVLREGARCTAKVLERLWGTPEVPPPPEVEETLREGHRVKIHYYWHTRARGEGQGVLVWLGGDDRTLHFRLPHHVRSEAFSLKASAGQVRLRVGPPGR